MATEDMRARLALLNSALDDLILGRKEVQVSYDGKAVTFTQANMGALRAEIAKTRRAMGLLSGRRTFTPVF